MDNDLTIADLPPMPGTANRAAFGRALVREGVSGKLAEVARSIFRQESDSGNNTRTSKSGAVGGMQMTPATFRRFADKGWSIDDPYDNARAGLRYIKALAKKTDGDPKLIAVGYYGGEGAIPKAQNGIAVSDPRDFRAPNTLQYADQVAGRVPAAPTLVDLPPMQRDSQAPSGHPLTLADLPPMPKPPPSFADDMKRQAELTARASGPYAAGAALGAAMGLPFAGIGAGPGAAAGVGAVALSDLASNLYNPVARMAGWRQIPGPTQFTNALMDRFGFAKPQTTTERVVQDVAGSMAGTGAMARAADVGANALAKTPVVRNVLAHLAQRPGAQLGLAALSGGAGGVTREAGIGPAGQFLASTAAGALPIGADRIPLRPGRSTINAARMIRQATEHHSPADWDRAQSLLDHSRAIGVPLLGPEAFPGGSQVQQLASDVAASPVGGNKLREFTRARPEQVYDVTKNALAGIGHDVGAQNAANHAQTAADSTIRDAQHFRTEAASPDYKAQRASDSDALQLHDDLSALNSKIASLGNSRDTSMQVAGKLHAFVNHQIQAANKTIRRGMGWAGEQKAQRNLDVAEQAKGATHEANNRARVFAAQIGHAERDMELKADQLAGKNLPAIQSKVGTFLGKLDGDIRLAGNTEEGRILQKYRDELAPGGRPLVLPSQLESVYKSLRNRTTLGMNPTSEERTTAGVLKSHVKDLDGLIREVSPAIAQGRQIYEQLSNELVDPLLKGPIGHIAGRGADAQKEATMDRAFSELQSEKADPRRIAEIAREFRKTDKTAFRNLVRGYLEKHLNDATRRLQSGPNRASGVKFSNALAGTPKDEENLQTMIQNVALDQGENPRKTWAGFRRMLDVLDATGRVPGMGSQTQSRAENAATARESLLGGAIDVASTHPTHAIADWVRNTAYRGTYRKLADVFTDPQAIRKMQELAQLPSKSLKAQQLVLSMLASTAQGADTGQ